MKHKLIMNVGLTLLVALLALNLMITIKARAAGGARSENSPTVQYHVVRVDPSTNQDLLFQQAGEKGLEFVGTIEVSGSTGYIIFKK